jgi:hypothetical protein
LSRRSRARAYGAAAALILAGVLCAALLGGGAGPVLAIVLAGLGLILALSLVFFEIGLSEDHDRARAQQRADRRRGAGPPAPGPGSEGQPRSGRLPAARRVTSDRMRGRRRRLR